MKNQFLKAIGYAIGVLVLVPLAIYLINMFFFKHSKVEEIEIAEYIRNSEDKVMHIDEYTSSEYIFKTDKGKSKLVSKEEAEKLGNTNSKRSLQIIDSLEQTQHN